MRTWTPVLMIALTVASAGATATPAYAQQAWSSMPAACASTDNNFYSGTPSSALPVVRFIVPGGAFTFNAFHDGYISFVCHIDTGAKVPAWNRLQVTYSDPDGLQKLDGFGTEYQAYVELVRVSKTTGSSEVIAIFDSNLQCAGTSTECAGTSSVKTISVPFTHTFNLSNYTYAIYGRLYRALSTFGLRPAIYQVRLQKVTLLAPQDF